LHGDGSGAFTGAVTRVTGAGSLPRGIAAGDVTGDGSTDAVVALTNTDKVMILVGDGQGGLTVSPTTYATTDEPRKVALGDFDDNGSLDIATADSGDGVPSAENNTTTLLLNDGTGVCSPRRRGHRFPRRRRQPAVRRPGARH
jgi:hypothetical protein